MAVPNLSARTFISIMLQERGGAMQAGNAGRNTAPKGQPFDFFPLTISFRFNKFNVVSEWIPFGFQ
jgi:hypothetical protein